MVLSIVLVLSGAICLTQLPVEEYLPKAKKEKLPWDPYNEE